MEALVKWLDRGDVQRIAKKVDITPRQANNIIKGKSKNFSFIKRLAEVAESNMRLAEQTQLMRENLKLIQ